MEFTAAIPEAKGGGAASERRFSTLSATMVGFVNFEQSQTVNVVVEGAKKHAMAYIALLSQRAGSKAMLPKE